jgi:MoxR-like ATPase
MAKLKFIEGPLKGKEVDVSSEGVDLGRSERCGLTIDDGRMSGEHALIRLDSGSWWVYDQQSTNGTFVNGEKVQALRVNEGDRVTVGDSIFEITDLGGQDAAGAAEKSPGVKASNPADVVPKAPTTPVADDLLAKPLAGAPTDALGEDDLKVVQDLNEAYNRMREEIARVIVGQADVVEQLLVAIFCRGHALLVGVPGLAKTLLVRTLSHVLDMSYNRIQFTPDLMPSDITGTDILEEDHTTGKRVFRFVQGPIFANLVLADEINRTPPKTQAALLEAMQEHRTTVGGKTYHLPEPFFVLATQNPIEQEGTYPLPEAQLDRFMFNIIVDYPDPVEESDIIKRVTGTYSADLQGSLTADDVLRLQQVVRRVPVADHVIDFARDLARATRPDSPEAPDFVKEMVAWGAGPRAGIYLILAAKANAILHGRYHAITQDVTRVALPVLRHRVLTTFNAEAAGIKSDEIIQRLVEHLNPKEEDNL